MAFDQFPETVSELLALDKKFHKFRPVLEACIHADPRFEQPISLDLNRPNSIKIARGIYHKVQMPWSDIKKSWSITAGDGSRGRRGSNNQGLAFEREVKELLEDHASKTSRNYLDYEQDIIDAIFGGRKEADKYRGSGYKVLDESRKNTKRHLVISGNKLLVSGKLSDAGKKLSDITVVLPNKDPIYVSLKKSSNIIGNFGIRDFINSDATFTSDGDTLAGFFGIDPDIFKKTFDSQSNQGYSDVTSVVDRRALGKFFDSVIGTGYMYVHSTAANTITFKNSSKPNVNIKKVTVYYGGKKTGTKQVLVSCDRSDGSIIDASFRNYRGRLYPNVLTITELKGTSKK